MAKAKIRAGDVFERAPGPRGGGDRRRVTVRAPIQRRGTEAHGVGGVQVVVESETETLRMWARWIDEDALLDAKKWRRIEA